MQAMYLVHYFEQTNYEFVMSLHSTLAAAETAAEAVQRQYGVTQRMLPDESVSSKDEFFDECGEGVHIYEVTCDGELAGRVEWGGVKEAA